MVLMTSKKEKGSKLETPTVFKKKEKDADIRPEYVEKIRRIEKQKNIKIKDINSFFEQSK